MTFAKMYSGVLTNDVETSFTLGIGEFWKPMFFIGHQAQISRCSIALIGITRYREATTYYGNLGSLGSISFLCSDCI